MIAKLIITSLCFICTISFNNDVYASTSTADPEKGNQAFAEGRFEEAKSIWLKLYASGNTDPRLYFNIGQAESKLNNRIAAISWYEKAARFRPYDKEIKDALSFERNRSPNAINPINRFFIASWMENLVTLFRPGLWAFFGLLFLLYAALSWIIVNRKSTAIGNRWYSNFWFPAIFGLLLILTGFISFKHVYRKNEAIIVKSCEMRQGPAEQSPIVRAIDAGERIRMIDSLDGWLKVRLTNLEEGWLTEECAQWIDAANSGT